MEPKVKRRIQDHCPELRMPRVDWKSYTLDDIEEIIAFYLGVKTAPDPMQDMQIAWFSLRDGDSSQIQN